LNPTFSGNVSIKCILIILGLKKHEIDDLASYFHFRQGLELNQKILSNKGDKFVQNIDIFEPVANDQPHGKKLY
jgi:hypothetical protein